MNSKSGLSTGQIFTYISAVVIVGVVFYIGTSAIINYWDKYNEAQLIKFQKQLVTDVNKVLSEPDSMETESYNLPSGYAQICFINVNEAPPLAASVPKDFRLVHDSWSSGALENVFLLGEGEIHSFFIGDAENAKPTLQVENRYMCIEGIDGAFKLRFVGQGAFTTVSEVPLAE